MFPIILFSFFPLPSSFFLPFPFPFPSLFLYISNSSYFQLNLTALKQKEEEIQFLKEELAGLGHQKEATLEKNQRILGEIRNLQENLRREQLGISSSSIEIYFFFSFLFPVTNFCRQLLALEQKKQRIRSQVVDSDKALHFFQNRLGLTITKRKKSNPQFPFFFFPLAPLEQLSKQPTQSIDGNLVFSFTQIDPEDPLKTFRIAIHVHDNGLYEGSSRSQPFHSIPLKPLFP